MNLAKTNAIGSLLNAFFPGLNEQENMSKENNYIKHFYEKYQGRVAIGVGYNENLTEIYPIVFQDSSGESIGIVALGVLSGEKEVVHIYHLGAFITNIGKGSIILSELCHQADQYSVCLSVSAVSMPNGENDTMDSDLVEDWYKGFGFEGDSGLLRQARSS
jgi:hypothetical protein